MPPWPCLLLLTALLCGGPLTAQEGEIFIPGASEQTIQTAPAVPRNRLAACLADVKAANCAGVEIDSDGIALESFSGCPDITFETLTLDLNSGSVSTSAAPPAQRLDYAAPNDRHQIRRSARRCDHCRN